MFWVYGKGEDRIDQETTSSSARWFERTAPSGVLKQGTQFVDGIFGGKDPANFVWTKRIPMDAPRLHLSDSNEYHVLAAKMHFEDWSNEFSSNKRSLTCF